MSKFRIAIALLAIFFGSGQLSLHADILQYSFNGQVPVGSNNLHWEGQTFTATFEIDTSVPDSELGDPNLGVYFNAATIGVIEFSGGFAEVGGPLDVYIYDDYGAPNSDLVAISGFIQNNPFIVTASNFSDLSTLQSDALPGNGISFESAPDPAPTSRIVLSYVSQGISYTSDDAHNVSFAAQNIPEPSSAIFIGLGMIAAVFRRRKSDRPQPKCKESLVATN